MAITGYRYSGDIKKLKGIGYKFHKLYGRNYKCYNKKDVWLFVKGGMFLENNQISHPDNWTKVIAFILKNLDMPDQFWYYNVKLPLFGDSKMSEFRLIDGIIYSNNVRQLKSREIYQSTGMLMKDGYGISPELVDQIKELHSTGELVLKEWSE